MWEGREEGESCASEIGKGREGEGVPAKVRGSKEEYQTPKELREVMGGGVAVGWLPCGPDVRSRRYGV